MYLHESEKEPPGSVADGLLGVAEAVDDGRDQRVEVELEVVTGAHGGGVESLERALRDLEAAVLQEIQAAIDERSDPTGAEAPSGSFQHLVEALHARHALLRVLRACELERFLHRIWHGRVQIWFEMSADSPPHNGAGKLGNANANANANAGFKRSERGRQWCGVREMVNLAEASK